jgi:hypothetical protein
VPELIVEHNYKSNALKLICADMIEIDHDEGLDGMTAKDNLANEIRLPYKALELIR